jgi:predicted kinase
VLAEANLIAGNKVVVDCVNPVSESRSAWKAVASRVGVRIIDVEVICSDTLEHRRRVEGRSSDIPGLVFPTWQAVLERDYEPWREPHLVIDTARLSPNEAISAVEHYIAHTDLVPTRG